MATRHIKQNRIQNLTQGITLISGYNNNISTGDDYNYFSVTGAPSVVAGVITSISKTRRKAGDIIKIYCQRGTFSIMSKMVLDGLVSQGLATAPNVTSSSIVMTQDNRLITNYVTLVQGESVELQYTGSAYLLITRSHIPNLPQSKCIRQTTGGVSLTARNSATIFSGFASTDIIHWGAKPASLGSLATGGLYSVATMGNGILQNSNFSLFTSTIFEMEMPLTIQTVSSATQRYILKLGITNNTTGLSTVIPAITEGCYLEYTDAVNTGRWQIKSAKAGVTTISNPLSLAAPIIAVASSLKMSSDGTNIVFSQISTNNTNPVYIGGVPISSITTTPVTGGLNMTCDIQKTVGTTGQQFNFKNTTMELYNTTQ